jgi:hypothetical protein
MNKKKKLEELYRKLTGGQKFGFNFLYGSLDTITDDKIDAAITTCEQYISRKPNLITTLPSNSNINFSTASVIPTATHCLCGNIPSSGDIFYYHSKYSKVPLEGIVSNVQNGYIRSKNGTHYKFEEITVKPKSEIRDELINEILRKSSN